MRGEMGRGVAVGQGVCVGTCVDVGVRVSVGRMVLVAIVGVNVTLVAVIVGVGGIDVEALQAPSSAKVSKDVMRSCVPLSM
jgi:hypothetical protein